MEAVTETGEIGQENEYSFLEKFSGIKWYFPGEAGLVVPSRDSLEIDDGKIVESPSFAMRWIGKPYAKEWALFNKMNTNLIEKKGFQVYKSAHTFHEFLPPSKYFLTHPEYYASRRGVRIPKQLCTSNPDVINLMATAIINLLNDQPYLDIITLFPEDGLHFCECDRCKSHDDPSEINVRKINSKWIELSPEKNRALSRRMADFYISVAEKVRLINPTAMIQVGAYSAYSYPPKNYNRKAPPNVFIYMTHGSCHNHPLQAPCPINARFLDAMEGWKNIFSGVTIYEYYRKVANIDLPFPIIHSIRRDILLYEKLGVQGLFTQFNKDYYVSGLNYFVAAKLLWDTSVDVDALLENFFKDFYGPAAKPMRDYWFEFEKRAIDLDIHLATNYLGLLNLYSIDLLQRQENHLNSAIFLGKDNLVKTRIDRAVAGFRYLTLVMEYLRYAQETAQATPSFSSGSAREGQKDINSIVKAIKLHRREHKKDEIFGGDAAIEKRLFPSKKIVDYLIKARTEKIKLNE